MPGGDRMEVDIREALRYIGAGAGDETLEAQARAVAREIKERPRYTYRVFDLDPTGPSLPELGLSLPGKTAGTMLKNCEQAILLSCTLGLQFDARLRAAQARDMAKALILDGCGSALVEQGCDAAEREIARRFPGLYLTDRFSPGYGDLPLSLQPEILSALDAGRRLGIVVSDSLLMTPGKSVTAIIGLSRTPQMARIRGCGYCSMRETCALRKGGNHCGL